MTFTEEQQAGIDLALAEPLVAWEALAGSGKSHTLCGLAKQASNERIMYTAMMRVVIDDAKKIMPGNVDCVTLAGSAFQYTGRPYAHRLSTPRLKPGVAAQFLKTRWFSYQATKGDHKKVSPNAMASLAQKSLINWCQSASPEIQPRHFVSPEGMPWKLREHWIDTLRPYVAAIWDDSFDMDGYLRYEHSYYLKAYELSLWDADMRVRCGLNGWPIMNYHRIIVDEAADINPVYISIINAHIQAGLKITMAGDSHQQITSFTGAMNAMSEVNFPNAKRAYFTGSFRFGPEIAEIGNYALRILGSKHLLTGLGGPSVVRRLEDTDEPVAKLYRKNKGLIAAALAHVADGKRISVEGGVADLVAFARAAGELREGKFTYHRDLVAFDTWQEVIDYVADDPHGQELKLFVDLITAHGAGEVERLLGLAVDRSERDTSTTILSTAHKSKGSTFANVWLSSDMLNPMKDIMFDDEEVRLNYVAATRPQQVLDASNAGLFSRFYPSLPPPEVIG
jgi:hypothetical protein